MDSRLGQRDSVQPHQFCLQPRAPRFLAERISNIKASCSASILIFGDLKDVYSDYLIHQYLVKNIFSTTCATLV